MMTTAVSVAILAGGAGSRIGADKAELLLLGERLIDRAVRRIRWLSDDILVVARQDQKLSVDGAHLVRDIVPDVGVLAGLAAALAAARHPWTLALACDMPFVQRDLIAHMISRTTDCDAVVPCVAAGMEPLHALYHQRCLAAIHQALSAGRRRANSFHAAVTVCYLDEQIIDRYDPERQSFMNVNTAADLADATRRALLERQDQRSGGALQGQ